MLTVSAGMGAIAVTGGQRKKIERTKKNRRDLPWRFMPNDSDDDVFPSLIFLHSLPTFHTSSPSVGFLLSFQIHTPPLHMIHFMVGLLVNIASSHVLAVQK